MLVATSVGTIKCLVSAVVGAVITALPYEVATTYAATALTGTGVPAASNLYFISYWF